MKVILRKDVDKLGYANDIVDVKPGYANNYLLPNGLAMVATESAKKMLEENLKQRAHKDAKILADANALAEKLEAMKLAFSVKAEEGRIFGSVTSADVAKALADKGFEIDRKNIQLDPVKTVGEYEAVVRLHKEVRATVRFSVAAEGEEKKSEE